MVLTDEVLNGAVGSIQDQIDENLTFGAVGTGDSAEDSGQTGLDNEVIRKSRASVNDDAISGGSSSTTVSFFINSTEANGQTLRELGIFDASTGGNMKFRDVFNEVEKNNQIELFFDVQVGIEVSQ